MPPPDLRLRAADARELMDDPEADAETLARTYRRFALVNTLLSGWRGLYRRRIRPLVRGRDVRLLDIGSGGGDIARSLAVWSARDATRSQVLAADADPRATAWAAAWSAAQGGPANVVYTTSTSGALADAGERFDVVVSNHLLHHLRDDEVESVLADSRRLLRPGGLALHGDIARSPGAYTLFRLATWPFERNLLRGTFIRADGLTSIRRSYTAAELRALAPPGWRLRSAIPHRIVLLLGGDDDGRS